MATFQIQKIVLSWTAKLVYFDASYSNFPEYLLHLRQGLQPFLHSKWPPSFSRACITNLHKCRNIQDYRFLSTFLQYSGQHFVYSYHFNLASNIILFAHSSLYFLLIAPLILFQLGFSTGFLNSRWYVSRFLKRLL